jgi:hypothetical protein
MATVLEEYTTEDQRSVVSFLWVKEFNAKDIHKEIFPVYCRKCLSRKGVHNWAAKVSLVTRRLTRDAEVAETTVKKPLFFGFRRTGRAMGQIIIVPSDLPLLPHMKLVIVI